MGPCRRRTRPLAARFVLGGGERAGATGLAKRWYPVAVAGGRIRRTLAKYSSNESTKPQEAAIEPSLSSCGSGLPLAAGRGTSQGAATSQALQNFVLGLQVGLDL